jgi:catechol 2,3-dioxygenase-like lactoylglutathione lyase family enzyme
MSNFTWDHVHLRTTDPEAMAHWFANMLGAEVVRAARQFQTDGTCDYAPDATPARAGAPPPSPAQR